MLIERRVHLARVEELLETVPCVVIVGAQAEDEVATRVDSAAVATAVK